REVVESRPGKRHSRIDGGDGAVARGVVRLEAGLVVAARGRPAAEPAVGNGPAIGVVGDGAGLRRPSHVHRVQEPEERDRADALRCVRAPPGDRVTGVDGAGVAVVAEGSDAVADYDPEGVDLAPVSGGAAVLVVAGDAGDDRRDAGPRLAAVEGGGTAAIALARRVGARPGQAS